MFNPRHRQLLTCLNTLLLTGAAFAQTTAAPEPRVMEIVESRCILCHGREGESASAVYPRLAAQHPEYLLKQLKDFRDGRRKSDTMNGMVKDLKDDEFAGLASWFGSRKAVFRSTRDTDLAAVGKYLFANGNAFSGVPACSTCHGDNGHGTQQLPRLAGQHPSYLEVQLKEFGNRARTNDNTVMHSVASKLTELETRALSVYIGAMP